MSLVMDTFCRNVFFCTLLFIYLCSSSAENYNSDGFQHTLGHLRANALPEIQKDAAENLIRRIIGVNYEHFEVDVNPNLGPAGKDTFQLIRKNEKLIKITGTSGVAVAWGFYYYLKTYCNCHISWEGKQLQLPEIFPDVNETITSNDRFRYYQNVCTAGYSSTWWDWDQWEKNIDWMALNGINLALAFHAQEAIWQRVYLELNLTQEEIDQHFGGPAFLPWARMGNIRGWGGPLPQSWHHFTIDLQHKILNRMRSLGIIPVLPAFAGHVSRAFARIHPDANMTKISSWNRFEDKYCCPYLLSPQDPLFKTIGSKFLESYIKEFGTDHVYNCDTFNENEPLDTNLDILSGVGRAIYEGMTAADPQAIWMLQGWLFVNEWYYWTEDRVKSFITSVPRGKMIILDLQSEQFPQYNKFNSYYGQPFIWCMLHNFGGTLGMFGSAPIINQRVFEARNMNGSTMIGTGLTPEGINQNYVIYELMNEMAYRRRPVDLDSWFENYAARRYGAWNEYTTSAWNHLRQTVYNFVGMERIRGHYVITRRPSLRIKTYTWYDPMQLFEAWTDLLQGRFGRSDNQLYRHDVVDVTRQSLQLLAESIYKNIITTIVERDLRNFETQSRRLMEIFSDLERILQTNENFLLGRWISDARKLGRGDEEKNLYEYNARNQITLWGPNGEIQDYANKQWAGIMSMYFSPRWDMFLGQIYSCLIYNSTFNETITDQEIYQTVELEFTKSREHHSPDPQGDSIKIAVEIRSKWDDYIKLLKKTMFVKKI